MSIIPPPPPPRNQSAVHLGQQRIHRIFFLCTILHFRSAILPHLFPAVIEPPQPTTLNPILIFKQQLCLTTALLRKPTRQANVPESEVEGTLAGSRVFNEESGASPSKHQRVAAVVVCIIYIQAV